jgi:hypothetical protein
VGFKFCDLCKRSIRYLAKVPNTPSLNPLPLVRGGETKRSFGGVGFKFCNLYKRSIVIKLHFPDVYSSTYLDKQYLEQAWKIKIVAASERKYMYDFSLTV